MKEPPPVFIDKKPKKDKQKANPPAIDPNQKLTLRLGGTSTFPSVASGADAEIAPPETPAVESPAVETEVEDGDISEAGLLPPPAAIKTQQASPTLFPSQLAPPMQRTSSRTSNRIPSPSSQVFAPQHSYKPPVPIKQEEILPPPVAEPIVPRILSLPVSNASNPCKFGSADLPIQLTHVLQICYPLVSPFSSKTPMSNSAN